MQDNFEERSSCPKSRESEMPYRRHTFEDKSSKVISFVFMGILSLIIGGVCYLIPIVINPIVNYVGIPILQLLAAIFILNKSGRKDRAD